MHKQLQDAITRKEPLACDRRLPVGAEPAWSGGVHFRVWAPQRERVTLIFAGEGSLPACDLAKVEFGYFSVYLRSAAPGMLYSYRLDDSSELFPDPASRFQPEGPLGPSQIVDPADFTWTDAGWPGLKMKGQVIYEMHIGTFTREGTWKAARNELAELAELGITLLELMPVAEFAGTFGWSYDGVNLFAPTHHYGTPDEFREFVNEAHRVDLGVLLDVVYNHVSLSGNTLGEFSRDYFSDRYENEWGEAINFDGPNSGPVREFILANARYWIEEFHLDGVRIDATQAFFDHSQEHILTTLTRSVRDAARPRSAIIIGESEPQNAALVHPVDRGGYGMDALWNDDFHHAALVRLTGRSEAYYTDYRGTSEEFISAVKWGYLYQGQRYKWQGQRRGRPALDLAPEAFVNYLENHDQLANSARGERVHSLTSPGRFRAMTALFLLAPQTPLLFQGQEFGASTPFFYFNDGDPGTKVCEGRKIFLRQFRSLALAQMQERLPDPRDPETYQRCKLDFADRVRHANIYQLHQDLLRLRHHDPVISRHDPSQILGATVGGEALVLRFFDEHGADRLLVVNFGRQLEYSPCPQPLLAPPEDKGWELLWSSEHPDYGGHGTPRVETDQGWQIPGESAILLQAK